MSALRALRQLTSISSRALEVRSISSVARCRLPAQSARIIFAPAARAFSTSTRRLGEGATDNALSLKLADELQYEKEASAGSSEPEFLQKFKTEGIWEIEDTPGHDEVTLTRKFGNENIRMMFSISDTQLLSDDNEFEDGEAPGEGESEAASESESEEYPSSNQIRVSFAITKTSGPGVLNVDTACHHGAFLVDNMSYYRDAKLGTELTAEADWSRRGLYMGPQFDDLDTTLQEEFDTFLQERGINESLSLFVSDYAEYKERKEYARWLQNVKAFVDL